MRGYLMKAEAKGRATLRLLQMAASMPRSQADTGLPHQRVEVGYTAPHSTALLTARRVQLPARLP